MGKFDHRSTQPGNLSGTWRGNYGSVSSEAHGSTGAAEGAPSPAGSGHRVRFSGGQMTLTVKEQYKNRFAGHIDLETAQSPIIGAIDYVTGNVFMTSHLGVIDGRLTADGILHIVTRSPADTSDLACADLTRDPA